MSDFPNGRPPGQNNIDATTPAYVDPKNDPSANAVKDDSEQPKESGIEVREPVKPEVQEELDKAAKNIVEPGSAEDNQKKEQESGTVAAAKAEPDDEEDEPPPPKPAPAKPLPPSTTRR